MCIWALIVILHKTLNYLENIIMYKTIITNAQTNDADYNYYLIFYAYSVNYPTINTFVQLI